MSERQDLTLDHLVAPCKAHLLEASPSGALSRQLSHRWKVAERLGTWDWAPSYGAPLYLA